MGCERGDFECACACETLSERLSCSGMQPVCVFVMPPVQLRFPEVRCVMQVRYAN